LVGLDVPQGEGLTELEFAHSWRNIQVWTDQYREPSIGTEDGRALTGPFLFRRDGLLARGGVEPVHLIAPVTASGPEALAVRRKYRQPCPVRDVKTQRAQTSHGAGRQRIADQVVHLGGRCRGNYQYQQKCSEGNPHDVPSLAWFCSSLPKPPGIYNVRTGTP